METEAALNFLMRHQPMPDDAYLTEDLAQEYDSVRQHFVAVNDKRSVPLLLNSFGRGNGFGCYQLVEDAVRNQDRDAVVVALPSAIRSDRGGVRNWVIEIAVEYPDRTVVSAIKDVWHQLDSDSRFWAAKNLLRAFIPEEDTSFLVSLLRTENDEEVRAELVKIGAAT